MIIMHNIIYRLCTMTHTHNHYHSNKYHVTQIQSFSFPFVFLQAFIYFNQLFAINKNVYLFNLVGLNCEIFNRVIELINSQFELFFTESS